MTLQVIGVGFGRTATMSLRAALEEIGYGPCYHMVNVLENMDGLVPLWNAALEGKPDWDAIYSDFQSAVDWPTAAFWEDLIEVYPKAKIILSSRSADSWYKSISQTILAILNAPEQWPDEMREWAGDGLPRGGRQEPWGSHRARCGHRCIRCPRGFRQVDRPGQQLAGVPGRGRMGSTLRIPRQACARRAVSQIQLAG